MRATVSMTMGPGPTYHERTTKSGTLAGGVIAVALHVVIILIALQFDPVRSAITAAAPIMVRLVSPVPVVEKRPEPPKPLPVKPRVQKPKPVARPPITTAITAAPAPVVAPVQPPTPLPPIEAPSAPVAAAPPAPVIPPNFNADYLNNPPPAYPALSRRMGEEGKVVLRVFVNEQGLPAKVELRTSSGFDRLDSVAQETVRHWKFVPARRGDHPVAAWVLVPISFSLRS